MRSCIIPGSFDPFTLGHLDIVKRAAKLFDKVYVAIMINSAKTGAFDFAKRKKIAELSCAGLDNVEIITADGLLCELCRATAREYSFISSTFVRDLIKYEKSLSGVMHPDAIEYIYEI